MVQVGTSTLRSLRQLIPRDSTSECRCRSLSVALLTEELMEDASGPTPQGFVTVSRLPRPNQAFPTLLIPALVPHQHNAFSEAERRDDPLPPPVDPRLSGSSAGMVNGGSAAYAG